MINKILLKKYCSLKQKVKILTYYLNRRKGARKSWRKRHSQVLIVNSHYNKPCDSAIEREHIRLWSQFNSRVNLETLRICSNISGRVDPRIVPEEVFVTDIEPNLIMDKGVKYISNKSFYNQWFPKGIFPKDLFHCIEGRYYNEHFISQGSQDLMHFARSVTYPVVLKPNRDSFGGRDIHFAENSAQLLELAYSGDNFIVQEKIEQHKFFNEYNPSGLNTVRVYVYRSFRDNRFHILGMALRMGRGGSLDNETAGGIHCRIRPDGFLDSYALDKYGARYDVHPDTNIPFNRVIPALEELKNQSLQVAEKLFYTRIAGLDACYDRDGNWRMIEINTEGHTIRSSQYWGVPFFGDFTDEVIKHCVEDHWVLKGTV